MTGIWLEPGDQITTESSLAVCWDCREWIPIPDGTYTARDRGVVFTPNDAVAARFDPMTGRRWSRPGVQSLIAALEEVQAANPADLDTAIAIAEVRSAGAARLLRRFRAAEPWTRDQKIAAVGIVIATLLVLLEMMVAAGDRERMTDEQLVETVRTVLETQRQIDEGEQPLAPLPDEPTGARESAFGTIAGGRLIPRPMNIPGPTPE